MRKWFALASCWASSIAVAAPDAMEQQTLQGLHRDLARSFVLHQDLPLDDALRAAADAMSAAHLARIDQLLPAWVAEERQLQTASGEAHEVWEQYFAVWARVLNELALWQMEPGDAAYENATLAVVRTSPLTCRFGGDARFSDYASRIARVQAMPPSQRDAALATERQLLAHWGQTRPALAPWPDQLPRDAAVAALTQAGGQQARLALPPLLAAELLGDQKNPATIHPEEQCRLQQWWLRESLRRGATPAAALNTFRYGTLITADQRFAGTFDAAPADGKPEPVSDKPPYPKIALRFMVTGRTTLSARLDAAGKPKEVSIIERKISMPGVRDARPIAFETIFDQASVNYARDGYRYEKPKDASPSKLQLIWTLPGADE
jgi:hypothetical protein